MTLTNYEKIRKRIAENLSLTPYSEILLFDGWADNDAKAERIATAPIEEILQWVKGVRESERNHMPQ
jgi:hypothetical protein